MEWSARYGKGVIATMILYGESVVHEAGGNHLLISLFYDVKSKL